jgi:predicted nucleotidyltransferase component of viral defense system
MINIGQVKQYYSLSEQKKLNCIVKEDIQLNILNFLSSTKYAQKLCFIGGTSLRLVHGIDRFSEDLDFDIKQFSRVEFKEMTGTVETYLRNSGFEVIAKYEKEDKLKAFRCALEFPGFAYQQGLSPHKDKKFEIKIECQDQGVNYLSRVHLINRNNYVFNFPVPMDDVLCSMKISALLQRQKGRDFYDVMFLLNKTAPNMYFLRERAGITNMDELRDALLSRASSTNLQIKSKDFLHLEINENSHKKILLFKDFVEQHKLIGINDILKQSVRQGDMEGMKDIILKGADYKTLEKSDFNNLTDEVKYKMGEALKSAVSEQAEKDNLGRKTLKGGREPGIKQ